MKNCCRYFTTSVGQKGLVGVTGLLMSGFVFTHMAGNLLVFVGPEAYNMYGYGITHGMAYPLIEVGLLLITIVHVYFAVTLNIKNRRVRSSPYAIAPDKKGASFASRSMLLTGLLTLVFIVLHLITFRFGEHYVATYGQLQVRDLYRLMVEKFKQPGYVLYYEFSLAVLFLHLSHGFKSTFQTLGFFSVKDKMLHRISLAFAGAVAVGFMAQPIYLYFFGV